MLVQFSFSNFKSFKDENTLNLVASNTKGTSYYAHSTGFSYSALKTLAVFGANASGKTKLFDAVSFMRCVICPPKRDEKIPVFDYWQTKYDAFRLNSHSQEEASFFEAVFIIEGIQYRYGFTLDKSMIHTEWLYSKKKRETLVFSREDDVNTKINKAFINDKIYNTITTAGMISSTVPLLSILSTFNDPLSVQVLNWFKGITVISANDLKPINALADNDKKCSIVSFLKAFDIDIEDIALHEVQTGQIPEKIYAIMDDKSLKGQFYDGINTTHKVYNELFERTGSTTFSLEKDESFGTNRLCCLSWPIIQSLRNGTVLFIDEFDSGIHTNVVKVIIGLYYVCSSKAQLIINTQDASLLSAVDSTGQKLFRKDQIYMVNKNRYGESTVLPATEFKDDLRANIEKMYLDGDITGVPFVNTDSLMDIIEKRP